MNLGKIILGFCLVTVLCACDGQGEYDVISSGSVLKAVEMIPGRNVSWRLIFTDGFIAVSDDSYGAWKIGGRYKIQRIPLSDRNIFTLLDGGDAKR